MKKIISIFLAFALMSSFVFAVSTTIVSDTSNTWYNGADVPAINAWVHPSWPSITGAKWIWAYEKADSSSKFGPYFFTNTFVLPDNAINIKGTSKPSRLRCSCCHQTTDLGSIGG